MGDRPTPEALHEGHKHARIHGYAWSNDTAESFAAGWALGVAEGRLQVAREIVAAEDAADDWVMGTGYHYALEIVEAAGSPVRTED